MSFTIFAAAFDCWADPRQVLTEINKQVSAEFSDLDAELRQAAEALAETGITGEKTREVLISLCRKFDYAADCSTIDLKGCLVTLEPEAYRKFEGKDISDQDQVYRILQTGKPVMSNLFPAVEGFAAIDVEYPITTPAGRRLGSVSILFYPEKMLDKMVKASLKRIAGNIWIVDEEGALVYNTEKNALGLNLLTSEPYRSHSELIYLGRQIVAQQQGEGFYSVRDIIGGKTVKNKVVWQSVFLYKTAWRLVFISKD